MSLPPPALKQIVAVLRRQARKFGGTLPTDGNTIRGLFTKADKEYEHRGRADDTFRFLRNHGILVEDTSLSRFYIDTDQAEKVLQACERHSAAPNVPDRNTRLETLKTIPSSTEDDAAGGTRLGSGEYDLKQEIAESAPVDAADDVAPVKTDFVSLHEEGTVAEVQTRDFLPHTTLLSLTVPELRVYVETLEQHLLETRALLLRQEQLDTLKQRKLQLERELAETNRGIDEITVHS